MKSSEWCNMWSDPTIQHNLFNEKKNSSRLLNSFLKDVQPINYSSSITLLSLAKMKEYLVTLSHSREIEDMKHVS